MLSFFLQLKPYVPYKVTEVRRPKVKSRELFDLIYAEGVKSEVDSEVGEQPKKRTLNFSLLSRKKSS